MRLNPRWTPCHGVCVELREMIAGGECAPAPGTSAVNSIPKHNSLNNDFEYFCAASRIGPDPGQVQQLSQGAPSNSSASNLSYAQAVLPGC